MKFNTSEAIKSIEYNTSREDLIIPEYGRHLQKLIDQVILIEDREERNKAAQNVIDIMGTINPHLRDVLDFKHKLWDQLFKMSRYELDADSPYPKPNPEKETEVGRLIEYPKNNQNYRYYGNHIVTMIDEAVSWEDGEKKNALILVIANQMKKSYMTWNKGEVNDHVIFNHLYDLSKGAIDLRNQDNENTVNLTVQTPRGNFQNRNTGGKQTYQKNTNQRQSNYTGGNQKRFVKKTNSTNNNPKNTNRKTN